MLPKTTIVELPVVRNTNLGQSEPVSQLHVITGVKIEEEIELNDTNYQLVGAIQGLRQHFTAIVKKDNMFFHIDDCKVDTPSAASSMESSYETNAKDGLFIFVYERVAYEPVLLDPSVVLTSDPSLVESTGVNLQQTELHIDVKQPVTSSEQERCDQVQAECTSTVHKGNVPHTEMD